MPTTWPNWKRDAKPTKWDYDHGTLHVDRNDFSSLLEHHRKMARFLDSLDTAHKRQLAAEDIQSTFNAARHEAAEISHFLEAHYQDLPTELRPPPEYPSCALQVFHTPELLEQIFLELDLRSLLNASQTCKIMSVVIPASRRLQRALSMHPESDCFWHTSFRSHVLFPLECSWQHDYLEVAPGGSQKGMITVEMHEAFPVPRAGSRVRALYICQPPIHVLDMLIECCKINTAQTQYADEAFDYRISSPDGITVGDVLDMTQHLRKVHRDCPFAGRGMMNRDGTAKPRIWYSTPLDLPYDHPLLARRRTAKVKQPKSREQRVKDAEEALLKRYARYKKNSYDAGASIPSFVDYKTGFTSWLAGKQTKTEEEKELTWLLITRHEDSA